MLPSPRQVRRCPATSKQAAEAASGLPPVSAVGSPTSTGVPPPAPLPTRADTVPSPSLPHSRLQGPTRLCSSSAPQQPRPQCAAAAARAAQWLRAPLHRTRMWRHRSGGRTRCAGAAPTWRHSTISDFSPVRALPRLQCCHPRVSAAAHLSVITSCPAGPALPGQVRDGKVTNITCGDVPKMLEEGWVVLDVRPPSEVENVSKHEWAWACADAGKSRGPVGKTACSPSRGIEG